MTCTDFELLLDEQFGPALLRDDSTLAEHATACGACRAQWDRHRALSDAIGVWRSQAPEVDLTAAVLAGLGPQVVRAASQRGSLAVTAMPAPSSARATASRQPPRQFATRVSTTSISPIRGLDRSRRSLVAAALALTSVIVVLMFAPSWRDTSRPAHSITANSRHLAGPLLAPSTAIADTQHQQDLAKSQADAMRPEGVVSYTGLAQLAAVAWDEVSLLVRPESSPAALQNQSPQPEGTRDGWIDGLQHQLKPIGKGLDNAFDFLWQAGQSGDG